MKGLDLIIRIFKVFIVSIGVALAVLDYYNSWSDHVVDDRYRPVLNLILIMISLVFLFTSIKAVEKDKVLTKVFYIPLRLGWALRVTGFLFICIIIFELNNKTVLLNLSLNDKISIVITYHVLHYVFTALSIISGYLTMLFYFDTKKERLWSYIGVTFGAILFSLGFAFHLYSVSWSEVLVSIPLLFWIRYLLKNKYHYE